MAAPGILPAFRVEPNGPPHAYQSYAIRQRPDVRIPAACADADPPCQAWLDGWETVCDERTDDGYELAPGRRIAGAVAAAYIRQRSGRTFREMRTAEGLTVFRFERGQRCFAEHGTIPRKLLVVHGDWRRHFGTIRRHTSLGHMVEDAVENCDRVWSRVARG